jgi:4-hydroxy-tetrahydrodipicolinate synthase
MNFKGSMAALVTPMHEDGSIDKEALYNLVEWHIQSKTTGLIIAGTTGEGSTLEPDEQFELLSLIIKQVAGRIPVIAGTGTHSTKSTIKLTENAKRAGADACLIVTPYYNKPTQNGLYQHYKTIAETVNMPIILYNVPGRTSCDMLAETVERLSKIKNIIGIKEATGKLDRSQDIYQRCGKSFVILSGDDLTALDLMQHGGAQGVISVTANVAPAQMSQMCDAALRGDFKSAEQINSALVLLHKRLFLEANPIPVKWALQAMGKIKEGIRLPLLPLDSKYHEEVKEALRKAGIMEELSKV